jgi:serine protease AprX
MTDLGKPILRVSASQIDYLPKPGGGGAKPPLVPITQDLLRGLVASLDDVIAGLPPAARAGRKPAAMVVRLREAAWAKSNRPNKFFEQAGLQVAAIERVGELIVPVTSGQVHELQSRILGVQSNLARYAVSTIEGFSHWTAEDVFPSLSRENREGEIAEAIEAGRRFRVELFPWANSVEGVMRHGNLDAVFGPESSRFLYLRPAAVSSVFDLASEPEVRHVVMEPQYAMPTDYVAQMFQPVSAALPHSLQELSGDWPLVGVIDSGISAPALASHVVGRTQYELPPDTDYVHGTFVGGLAAASRALNNNDGRFPEDRARLVDVVALPAGPVAEGDLLYRVEDAVRRHPEVKVWNCSFASQQPNNPPAFGPFAAALDRISDEAGVLFVIAAGNYPSLPVRGWPAEAHHFPDDRVAMPGESVRSLTVGALAPEDCAVPAEAPAPYSRRGPGPAYSIKPEVVHYGGGIDAAANINGGVRSILPGDIYAESVGTSFSTPIISCIAANAWQSLEQGGVLPSPTLVKALIVHAAALNSGSLSLSDRDYFGHGMPAGSAASLFCDPNSFTALFDAELQQGADWEKTPYPIPACLLTADGALRAEVIVTLCYASPCNLAYGDEYVQHDIEMSFGTYDVDPDDPTKRKQSGKVPPDRPAGLSTREKALLEDGLKYSTTKVFRAKFPRGCSGDQWRLKLSLTRRLEVGENVTQPVHVLVTLRGLEPDLPVYADGIRAIPNNWNVSQIVPAADIRQRVRE